LLFFLTIDVLLFSQNCSCKAAGYDVALFIQTFLVYFHVFLVPSMLTFVDQITRWSECV